MMSRSLLMALAMLAGVHSAYAHGIAGNRFFPGTLSFDDPAVADEAILPNFASLKVPSMAATLLITGSIGRFFVFSLRPSEWVLTARGFTGTGAMLCGRGLT